MKNIPSDSTLALSANEGNLVFIYDVLPRRRLRAQKWRNAFFQWKQTNIQITAKTAVISAAPHMSYACI